ncbi:flavin reductase family protein [Gordonia alkaliphila]|uniref:Flavin reductase family protein n=1 Tax=Gordonia alkaliphila TaxID=1053547 RepID=A0ABP8Z3V8_9ACTN
MADTAVTLSLQSRFRDAMAGVCSPVAVVTSRDGDRPHGTTVSAFMSLSMEPPMIAVALDHGSDLLAAVRAHGRFGVNVLAAPQHDLAGAFARKGAAKFDGVSWSDSHGVPKLADVAGWVACEATEFVVGGDHTVLFGTVVEADGGVDRPLTYFARTFGTHLPHEVPLPQGAVG